MNKRIIAVFTLFAFVVFSFSCYVTKQVNVDDFDEWKNPKAEIIGYTESSGKPVMFLNNQSGEANEKTITIIWEIAHTEIMKVDIKNMKKTDTGEIIQIETNKDEIYRIISITDEDEEKFVVSANKISHIPLTEIASVIIRKFNAAASLLPIVIYVLGMMIYGINSGSGW
jgi:hypothetical protein